MRRRVDRTWVSDLNVHVVAPPFIVTVEMDPKDEADFDAWYRQEHLDLLRKVHGYRRSQTYKIGPRVPVLTLGEPPRYLAVHEVDNVKAFTTGPEAEAAWTEWTKKQVEETEVFIVRGWGKVRAVGF